MQFLCFQITDKRADLHNHYHRKRCNRRFIFESNFAKDMPRRKKILLEHRERVIRAFGDENEDYIIVADTLGVNQSNARNIHLRRKNHRKTT